MGADLDGAAVAVFSGRVDSEERLGNIRAWADAHEHVTIDKLTLDTSEGRDAGETGESFYLTLNCAAGWNDGWGLFTLLDALAEIDGVLSVDGKIQRG